VKRRSEMECHLLVARREKIAMTLRALFAKEVYIRLTEDNSTFICTVRRGIFGCGPTEVPIEGGAACRETPESDLYAPKIRARASHFFG